LTGRTVSLSHLKYSGQNTTELRALPFSRYLSLLRSLPSNFVTSACRLDK
jgi:hypothetical protein